MARFGWRPSNGTTGDRLPARARPWELDAWEFNDVDRRDRRAGRALSRPLRSRSPGRRRAAGRRRTPSGWIAGWTWGLGHASGVVVVAVLAVLLREMLPPIDVHLGLGRALVGAALIAHRPLGASDDARASGRRRTRHGRVSHNHLHVQAGPAWVRRLGHAHASFCMGVLHGVAGSSHFFGVLPALALPTRAAALMYIGAFGVGTVAAMTLFAAAVGSLGVAPGTTRGSPGDDDGRGAAGDSRRRCVAYCAAGVNRRCCRRSAAAS